MAETRGPSFVLALVGALALGAAVAHWLERGSQAAAAGSAVSETSTAAPEERGASAPPAAPGFLSGRVLDAHRRPLEDARVVLSRREVPELGAPAGEHGATSFLDECRTGPDGLFRFPLAPGQPVDVAAGLEGTSGALRRDAHAGDELELVVTPGVFVHGRVTRARDGAAVADASIRVYPVYPGTGPRELERTTASRGDGTFELRIPFHDGARLAVVAEELLPADELELVFDGEERAHRDVALEDGLLVTGRVSDAVTGAPIRGAEVGEGAWLRRKTTTDLRGEYRFAGFGAGRRLPLAARARGYGLARVTSVPAAVEGVVHLDFALVPARSVQGRVTDEGGAPIGGAYVAAVAAELRDGRQESEWLETWTDAAGRYRIESLTSDLGHALLVREPGFGTQVHDFPESELAIGELVLPDVVLRRPALLGGTALDERGEALAGVELELAGANHDRFRFTKGSTARAGSLVDRRSVTSDPAGRFWFGDLAAGRYELVARAAGRPATDPLVLELVSGEERCDVRVRLEAGAALGGQVVDDRGAPLAGVFVSARSERPRNAGVRPAVPVTVRTGADGRYAIAGLAAGEYTLRAYPLETPPAAAGEPYLAATVEHVTAGGPAVRIELPRGASIAGRLFDARGEPLAGFVVAAIGPAGTTGEYAETDGRGRFALAVPRGSRWALEVRGAPDGPEFARVFLRREDVPAGAQAVELCLVP